MLQQTTRDIDKSAEVKTTGNRSYFLSPCPISKLKTNTPSVNVRTGSARQKNQGVFVKHYAPGGNKVQKAIFCFKVKIKVTRSLTLVSLKGHHKWSIHAKYEVSISYDSKVIAKVNVDNRETDK